ncbi:acyl-CoA dehydrogenase family protein [Streptomyces noursei]|uniref:acyl-CoA dehydrogenase family protein n=1 Tax=Streptomyces noursei TaxID=1971 RepID=UPI003807EABA
MTATAVETAASLTRTMRDRAADWDARGSLPSGVRAELAATGLLGVDIPASHGGLGGTPEELGEVAARIGGACSALRGLLTVQGMVAAALLRWGTRPQRDRWVPPLASGERFAAFAATEEEAGTELGRVRTTVDEDGDDVVVTGHKRWVTFGQTADDVLVLGTARGRPTAVLVEGHRPGLTREPVTGQLGMRAAHIAHLRLDGVRVPRDNVVARPGLGLSHVAATALDHGRFTVAWGCVGMAETCLETAAAHAVARRQGGVRLAEHELIRAQLGRCAVEIEAARQLCLRAARLRAERSPEAVAATIVAKYAAARAAGSAGQGAVSTLGSAGCAPDSIAGRFFRDAKVMEIIEGSANVAELHIADRLLRRYGFRPGSTPGTQEEENTR